MDDSPPQGGLPSPPASPASSSLSLPTNMSLSEFMSDIEWSRAPSPFIPTHQLYGGVYTDDYGGVYTDDYGGEGGSDDMKMRIPELSLGEPYQSEDAAGTRGAGRGVNSPAHPELRLLIIDHERDPSNDDSDSDKGSRKQIVDVFRECGEDGEWEEWEEDLGSLLGESLDSRVSNKTKEDSGGEGPSTQPDPGNKVKILWNYRRSTLLYVLPPSRDWTGPGDSPILHKIISKPFDRLSGLFSSAVLDDPTAELRRMLAVPKLGLWTAVVLGMETPLGDAQQALLIEISHLAPTIPLPPPPHPRSTSHSHTHSPLSFQRHLHPHPHPHSNQQPQLPHSRSERSSRRPSSSRHRSKQTKRCIPSFRPRSATVLVQGLMGFSAADVRESLREDAAEGFLRWSRNRAASSSPPSSAGPSLGTSGNSKDRQHGFISHLRSRSDTVHPPDSLTKFERRDTVRPPTAGDCSIPSSRDHQRYSGRPIQHAYHYDPLHLSSILHLGLSICVGCVGLIGSKLSSPFPSLPSAKAHKPLSMGSDDFVFGLGLGLGVGLGVGVALSLVVGVGSSAS